MRRSLLALATAILALGLAIPASAADAKRVAKAKPAKIDKGMRTPPLRLPNYHKALWMSEWVACWRPESMDALASELRMRAALRRAKTPQIAARVLAQRAMRYLYEDPLELKIAQDGCRNGILWRHYHGR